MSDNNKKLVAKFADRFSVEPEKLLNTLKSTAFQQANGVQISDEQMMALLIVADQYSLNPFTKEIYAFPDKRNGVIPIVGVDGWSRLINENRYFDGMEFNQSDEIVQREGAKKCPEWIECVIYRKDRDHPIKIREYLDEVYRPPFTKNGNVINGPWQTHTKRMLRHKVMIQCARIAFGYAGIYDPDEAERIKEEPTYINTEYAVVSNEEKISKDQLKELKKLIKESGANEKLFLTYMKIDSLENLPETKFSYAEKELKRKRMKESA